MLKHGIQDLHGWTLEVPNRVADGRTRTCSSSDGRLSHDRESDVLETLEIRGSRRCGPVHMQISG